MTGSDFASLTPIELLTLCLYGEARGESPSGKLAVAHVVLNRLAAAPRYGKNIPEIILRPYQFSCFLDSDPNLRHLINMSLSGHYDPVCYHIASLALDGYTIDPTGGANLYHVEAMLRYPAWTQSPSVTVLMQIGNHLFYREEV